MSEGVHSLGFLRAQLVQRPEWLSSRIPETSLAISPCHGQVSPDALPLMATPELDLMSPDTFWLELGLLDKYAADFQAGGDSSHFPLADAPQGEIIGYEVIGIDGWGMGWHSQHCHNAADSAEAQSFVYNNLGLLERREDAVNLADWYLKEESGAEPVFWTAVSIHKAQR